MKTLGTYFSQHDSALQVRNQRLQVISENIANASTPGFRARDIDFAAAMRDAGQAFTLRATAQTHYSADVPGARIDDALVYRTPLNPSLDSNTVEIGVEQAKFGRAAMEYQASLQFFENKVSGLRKALRGE
ncbi:MAG: flagellar basal body rod protein FlgB [Pseudohongiellaceae bacterium]|jgi:flagellar basal-body rod protein FlgB